MKYALVTGGSRGIGRAICLKLATLGYHVLVNYNSNEAEADKTVELIKGSSGAAEKMKFNIGDSKQVEEVLGNWVNIHRDTPIEVLVNNAGIKKDNLMLLMPEKEWDEVLQNNLHSFFYVTRQVVPGMIFKRYGRVINVVSLSGIKGMIGQTNYSASKAGVIGATKALAQEVGRKGVTVNAVAPGFIKTDMTEGISEDQFKGLIPMQRFGTAEEVAEIVGFLASPGASYITGEVINVNGGLYT